MMPTLPKAIKMRPDLDLTDQQIFDKIVAHLRNQKVPASFPDGINGEFGSCYYRLKTGTQTLMCAAGCLIPDELYLDSMEGRMIQSLVNDPNIDADLRYFFRMHSSVMSDMQAVHDDHHAEWEEYFRYVAAKHNLLLDGEKVNVPLQNNPMVPEFLQRQAQLAEDRKPRYPDSNDGEL
jgi:hypothetical protein